MSSFFFLLLSASELGLVAFAWEDFLVEEELGAVC